MKDIGRGIAFLLFAILLKLCIPEINVFAILLGTVGLGISIIGSYSKSE